MKKIAREILYLKRGERRALFMVSILLCLSLAIRIFIPRMGQTGSVPDLGILEEFELLRSELDSIDKAQESRAVRNADGAEESPPRQIIRPQSFDPNCVNRAELEAMYLPEKVISNLIAYREAGAVFHSPEDLKRIYGMDEHIYAAIFPFVNISDNTPMDKDTAARQVQVRHKNDLHVREQSARLDLNTADSSDLVSIRGIGPFTARTVIRYRHLLGGFYAVEQLREVYGMDSSRYELLCAVGYVDSINILPLDINILTYAELLRHPYLSKKQVTNLIQYRDYAKQIEGPDELQKFGIIDSASYLRIAPYLRFRIN